MSAPKKGFTPLQLAIREEFIVRRFDLKKRQATIEREVGWPRPRMTFFENGYSFLTFHDLELLAENLGCRMEFKLIPIGDDDETRSANNN